MVGRCSRVENLRDLDHVLGLLALVALNDFKFNGLPGVQGLIPVALDGRIMDKDVLFAILRHNESKTLLIVEPFDFSRRHNHPSPFESQQIKKPGLFIPVQNSNF